MKALYLCMSTLRHIARMGRGVVDLAFMIGGTEQQAQAVELLAQGVLPELERWERDASSYVFEPTGGGV
jgi:hypothetical protein